MTSTKRCRIPPVPCVVRSQLSDESLPDPAIGKDSRGKNGHLVLFPAHPPCAIALGEQFCQRRRTPPPKAVRSAWLALATARRQALATARQPRFLEKDLEMPFAREARETNDGCNICNTD